MSNISNTLIEREGVAAVQQCLTRMGWIFRENSHTDYGIDGDVEQVMDDKPTNLHIALQIKSGPSYLKENKDGNITFYIDEWHYKYWLQSDRPVLILFYDNVNDRVIWEQVKLRNIQTTNSQYKIVINPTKILNKDCLLELNDIIATHQPQHFYELTDEYNDFEFSHYCYQELNRSIGESCNDVLHFREGIKHQGVSLNSAIIKSLINDLADRTQSRTTREYEWLHKGCWYLQTMAQHIDPFLFTMLVECVDEYITIIDYNTTIWQGIVNDISKLFHPNVPNDIQQCAGRCITIIEDRFATYELVKGEYQKCIRITKERK
ncbi:MAG: DUF4365 domain-containing protein [Muribaculaceae bacterium]|nr:DUF4365 domain-containing protein [Muribaculaceae bacterium]